ncbi:MAG: transglycosylase SLT domain-containing protein [Pyramidobacter sp.]|jgi:soluble lytic murein transglycosylase-like protein
MKQTHYAIVKILAALLLVIVSAPGCTATVPQTSARFVQDGELPTLRRDAAQQEAAAHVFCYYNTKLGKARAEEYARYVMEAARRYDIAPSLIAAMIVKESHAKANARSKYAVGLMQVYWKLHRNTIKKQFPHITTEKALMEPRNNIMVGTWIFSRYLKSCGGNEKKALQRYLGANTGRYVSQVMQYRKRFNERMNFNLQRHSKRSAA